MDGSLWRGVVDRLQSDHRCISPTLPLGGHRLAMPADADLSMGGIARILEELLERLDLNHVTLAMSDWGGPQLLVGGPQERRIARLVICSCEAFDNVPPKGSARLLPLLARVPGGVTAAMLPFRFQPLRRLPMTFGQMSRRPVPREVMDRWFSPLRDARIRDDLRRYVLSAGQGRRELLAAAERLRAFDRPALVAWATEDRLMPPEHGHRLAELLPQGRLVEVADSYTLIPEDQPELLANEIRELVARLP